MDRTEKDKNFAAPGSCPGCGHSDNPPGNRFCGCCGAPLERSPARGQELVSREESRVTRRERSLPRRLGPVGRTVAVGLAVAAADMGLAWLRRRLETTGRPVLPHNMGRPPWQQSLGGGSEYLYSYFLRETAGMSREGQETRSWFSSELTIRSSRTEK